MKKLSLQCEKCTSLESNIFCDAPTQHINEINEAKVTNHYKPREIIFHEGNKPSGLYCVSSGKVKIFKTDLDGNQQIVRLAGPGNVLGYRSLLSGYLHMASAEALEESTICFIDRATVFNVLQSHAKTAMHLMQTLATDLGNAEKQIVNVTHKSIRERMAELFLLFSKKYGKEDEKGVLLDITLTRGEIAELIGTTQESAIRLISEFKKEKLIHVDGRKIVLLDIPKIADIANLED